MQIFRPWNVNFATVTVSVRDCCKHPASPKLATVQAEQLRFQSLLHATFRHNIPLSRSLGGRRSQLALLTLVLVAVASRFPALPYLLKLFGVAYYHQGSAMSSDRPVSLPRLFHRLVFPQIAAQSQLEVLHPDSPLLFEHLPPVLANTKRSVPTSCPIGASR